MSDSTGEQTKFFQESVHLLCGNLDLETALRKFFPFLQTYVPIVGFYLSRSDFVQRNMDIVATCTASEIHVVSRRLQHPQILLELLDWDILRRVSEPEGWYSSTQDVVSDFACACLALGDVKADAPLFQLRMQHRDITIGGAIFTCSPDKPFSEEHLALLRLLRIPLLTALNNYFQYHELMELKNKIQQENWRLRQEMSGLTAVDVVGASGGLRQVMDKVRQVGPVDVPVLITGETGTGKELIAKALHSLSPRHDKPFVAVNCGAIPATLIDSELFGHVKGSFTGASYNHKGRFERAQGGTIFLDEIGELPLDVQARLLRVLQEHTIERVGGNTPIDVDFRLIAATNRDLQAMVSEGLFREDLYYRLCVIRIHLPPLRQRKQDIPLLVEHMLHAASMRLGVRSPMLDDAEVAKLVAYAWPGNVRELQNVVEEALVLTQAGPLRFWPEGHRVNTEEDAVVPPNLESLLRDYFQGLLCVTQGRIAGPHGAAAIAGINPYTLRSKLDKLHIPYSRSK